MTARDIYVEALNLLGYEDEQFFKSVAISTINRVYTDLFYCVKDSEDDYKKISSINDKVELPEMVIHDVMPYGVAMFFAQSQSDGDMQALYARLYNQKRGRLTQSDTVVDMFSSV